MGASEPEQASRYTKSLLGVSYLCMGTLSLIQLFFAGFFVGLFHLTPEAMAMATELLQVCAIGNIFLWPVAFVLPNALRAAGDSIFTMAVSQCAMFLCRVGLSYLLACSWGLGLGLLGVWLAMIGDLSLIHISPETKMVGILSLAAAISMPGTFLSQFGIITRASNW